MDLSLVCGLSDVLFNFFDENSFNFDENKKECSIDIFLKDECFINNKYFDKGILIAIVDTFSSYAVKFLFPLDDFRKYLSLHINLISFKEINKNFDKKLKIIVSMKNQENRDILLNIKILNFKNQEVCNLTHLKRRIK